MPSVLDDLFALDGRVALVTGASSGIGRQMAGALARAGAKVVLLARREKELAAAVSEIGAKIAARSGKASSHGAAAHALTADLMDAAPSEPGRLSDVARAAARPFGAPHILVNAAGINPRLPADQCTPEAWQRTLHLNLTVPFFLAQALAPGMRAAGYGRIINIASLQTTRAFTNGIAYGASKGGVGQLTRAMAEAWGKDGITANAIAPGFFPTELTAPVFADDALAGHHARMTCMGRNGALPDLDGATIFLASPAAAYVTGQILAVDGGYSAK